MKEKNAMKKRIGLIVALVTCMLMMFPVIVSASMADEAVSYEWGHIYTGNYSERIYALKIKQKSNVYFKFTVSEVTADLNIYNAEGKKILNTEDFLSTKNAVNEKTTYTCIRILTAGTYYIDCDPWNYGKYNCSFFATCEPAISLARPEITSIKNSAKKAMTIKVATVKNRTGFEYQYSTKSNFSDAKAVKGNSKVTVEGLTKGKTYYIRVRAYTIYGAGNVVYSAWSTVKYVKINK